MKENVSQEKDNNKDVTIAQFCISSEVDKIFVLMCVAVNIQVRFWFKFNAYFGNFWLQLFPAGEDVFPQMIFV